MSESKYILWQKDDNSTFDRMIRPFLIPIQQLGEATYEKLFLALLSSIFMVAGTVLELIRTPEALWVGLMILAASDFVAGTARAIFDNKIIFDWHRFGRTAYKLVVYPVVIVATATLGNMYPEIFGWNQYAVIAIIAGQELYSILRHVKGVAFVRAVIRIGSSKAKSIGSFSSIAKEIDDELYRSHLHKDYINEDHMTDKKKGPDN